MPDMKLQLDVRFYKLCGGNRCMVLVANVQVAGCLQSE